MDGNDRVRAWEGGRLLPVAPRRAATVLLLRDSPRGPEVYVLRRRSTMAFAAGMYAFPGGSVDPRDDRPGVLSEPDAADWAGRLGIGGDPGTARAVLCAAVRETFEEAGVLLAGEGDGAGTAVGTDAEREALVRHETSLADLLTHRGLALRADLLAPWARWITPEFEERRYDTWFFVAELPAGQRARDVSGEADRTLWTTPADAVTGHDEGRYAMLPPTLTALRELARHGSVAEIRAAAAGRPMAPVTPRASTTADGGLVLEWDGASPGSWSPRPRRTPDADPPRQPRSAP